MYTVMIVDDEKAIREGLALTTDFENYGFRVCATAKNGLDALEKTEDCHPDVVLLDVCMPVLDGIGYMEKVWEKREKEGGEPPCVVMLSGYSDFEYARAALRYGVKAYLTKPLEEEELGCVLEKLKEELDFRARKLDSERQAKLTAGVQRMYHEGDGGREAYHGCFLLHCVVLHADSQNEIYRRVRSQIEGRLPGGVSAWIRSRGSIFSYLVSQEVLASYQYSVTLLGRSILHGLKLDGIEAAALFDETIFERAESTFRNDYDTHLYRMLTEIFWGGQRLVQEKELPVEERTVGWEKEEKCLAELKKALQEMDGEQVREKFEALITGAEEKRLNMILIQNLNYRIFYMLTDLVQGAEEMDRLPLQPQEWRDSPFFACSPRWKEALWEQVRLSWIWLEENQKRKQSGVEEQVVAYMQRHFREPLLLKDVAERFFVSPAYLGRCIQKSTGISFKQYLNDMRMEEAMRLLEETDKLVYEIAGELGFSESKYFVSKFTEKVGKTPLEYRKSVKKAREV